MSHKLQNIINLLCDGECHSLDELREETHLNERQIEATVAFLMKYGFVENKGIGVRATRSAKKLLIQTKKF